MIGVIVVPGMTPDMHGLDAKRSSALLPLGDRPMLQHIVESLVAQKVTEIELIVGHAPERIEALLGNGDRWGGRFRYHLAAHAEHPYRSLKIIPGLKTEPWVLIHADAYPATSLPVDLVERAVVFVGNGVENFSTGQPMGVSVFPPGQVADALSALTPDELQAYLSDMVQQDKAEVVKVKDWLSVSSPAALLQSQTLLLERRIDGLTISGTEREPGVWISRNVAIHPSASFVAPVYVGPDTRINRGARIGPNAVIEGECIVDTNTSIENSMVTAGSYIGQGLELDQALVDHSLLINVRLGTGVNISESFLLGGLKTRPPQSWVVRVTQSILAIVLFVVFLPLLLIAFLISALRGQSWTAVDVLKTPVPLGALPQNTYPLPCLGKDAWGVPRRAGWGAFTRQFLPGLLAVAKGQLGFVGLPPRTVEQVESLSPEWQELYLTGISGLITEAALANSDPRDATQAYLADAYYSVRRGFLYNLNLAGKYFLRLLIPSH